MVWLTLIVRIANEEKNCFVDFLMRKVRAFCC